MQQSDPSSGGYQVDRYAVGDSYGEQDARSDCGPAVYSLNLNPTAAGIEAHDFYAVRLIPESDGCEFAELYAERTPPAHDLANRGITPEAEIEPAPWFGAPACDPGYDAVALAPTWNFEPRYRTGRSSLPALRYHA